MKTEQELCSQLKKIDKKSYSMYKSLAGEYRFQDFVLAIDHVQGDPFASPSRIRIVISKAVHRIPHDHYETKVNKTAAEDFLLRIFRNRLRNSKSKSAPSGSGHSGAVSICRCGQEVLERTAVLFIEDTLQIQLEVGLPARGRTILAEECRTLFCETLAELVRASFLFQGWKQQMQRQMEQAVSLANEQEYIRSYLREHSLTAFVADGAVLPRESGVSQYPLKQAVPFESPEHMRIVLTLPGGKQITGMALKQGITLIVGGGYHGKSTLLKALEAGVYNHIAGDGREYVITESTAVKIRAEDGRCIHQSDISPFISHLPNGQDTSCFQTENASGSTSQAANVTEAIEAGSRLILMDEDTTATNFMIRDERMAQLIAKEKEPITPFTERIRELYEGYGVSTILVVGSSGAYLPLADRVLCMDCYETKDVTEQAAALCNHMMPVKNTNFSLSFSRSPKAMQLSERGRGAKIKSSGTDTLVLNREAIDVRYLEQLVDEGQTIALGYLCVYALEQLADGKQNLRQVMKCLEDKVQNEGLLSVTPKGYPAGAPVLPRIQEVYQCLNRYRELKFL